MSIGPNTAIVPRSIRVEGDREKKPWYDKQVMEKLSSNVLETRKLADELILCKSVRDNFQKQLAAMTTQRDRFAKRCAEIESAISSFEPGWVVCKNRCCLSAGGFCSRT